MQRLKLAHTVPENLSSFFRNNPKIALAFSGGVDSSYLLYAAKTCGVNIKAYFAQTCFQPAFERKDAIEIAAQCNAELTLVDLDILQNHLIKLNPSDRCYHCKQHIFSALIEQAGNDGYSLIIDGTNASDDIHDRPGMQALAELSVLSPLRLCGIRKVEVRMLAKRAGLSIWNKPAYACLATRIETGAPIDPEMLDRIEAAENALTSLGYTNFRVRVRNNAAMLQFTSAQLIRAANQRKKICQSLSPWFSDITLDLFARTTKGE